MNRTPDLKSVGADEDGLYPMRLVTRLTGLSADTIRAWERRYQAVTPDRSAGNTRRFSTDDIRRLNLLREAVERGHTIGAIAQVPTAQLATLLNQDQEETRPVEDPPTTGFEKWREGYIDAIGRFELNHAYQLLRRAATLIDRHAFVFDVVVPLIRTVGDRWKATSFRIAEEHIVSRQLASVLDVLIDTSELPSNAPKILLTTPPGHRHEFGALIASLLAVDHGVQPLYLGADMPLEELSWAVKQSGANVVVLSVARDLDEDEARALPKQLALIAGWTDLWLGLPPGHPLADAVPKARVFHSYEDFEDALDEL